MKKQKLLICDVDGTLVNSNAGFSLAILELLSNQFDTHVDANQVMPLSGLPLREIIEKFVGKVDSNQYHKAAKHYRDIYNSKYISQVDLFPDVKETLAAIKPHCFLSTATNLPSRQTNLLFEKLEISSLFDKIRGTDMEDNPKPNPDLLNEAMFEFNMTTDSTYMIGDSFNDIKAGKNANVKTIAICYQQTNNHYIDSLNPDYTIHKFSQISTIIGR